MWHSGVERFRSMGISWQFYEPRIHVSSNFIPLRYHVYKAFKLWPAICTIATGLLYSLYSINFDVIAAPGFKQLNANYPFRYLFWPWRAVVLRRAATTEEGEACIWFMNFNFTSGGWPNQQFKSNLVSFESSIRENGRKTVGKR